MICNSYNYQKVPCINDTDHNGRSNNIYSLFFDIKPCFLIFKSFDEIVEKQTYLWDDVTFSFLNLTCRRAGIKFNSEGC